MSKAHYYLLLINDETVKYQTNLEYNLKADEDFVWDELIYTIYDTEDQLEFPSSMDEVRILRNNAQPTFVESSTIINFVVDKVEILEILQILSSVDMLSEITVRLSSAKRNKE